MNQNSLVDSAKSSPTGGLNPVLTQALASLEVQLEQELTRYRRTRKNPRKQPSESVKNYAKQMKTDLLNIQLPTVPPIVISPENPLLTTETTEETPIPVNLEKSSSSIVPTKIQPIENQTLFTANDSTKPPDDYLESSEALLRSLTPETSQTQTPNSPESHDRILSPMGIGSILLLLLSSLTLGYVVFNPQNFPKLNFDKLINSNSSKTAENTEVTEKNSQPNSQVQNTPIAKYPNLATQEFREVRDPKDVVDLTPKAKPTSQIIPTPPAIQPAITPLSNFYPLPTLSTPLPKSTTIPSALPEDVKPSANGYYYIIADNQGNNAFKAAKQIVPDAYLSPNKKFIYLGALKTKDDIKRRLQELQEKGIKARLQQP